MPQLNNIEIEKEEEFDLSDPGVIGKAIAAAGMGYIFAYSPLFGIASPFAAALVGSLRGYHCLFAFAGAIVSYCITGQLHFAAPSLAAMIAILAVKAFMRKSDSGRFEIGISIISGISAALTGIVSASDIYMQAICLSGGIITGGCTFFLINTYRHIGSGKSFITREPVQSAAIGAVFTITVCSLTGFEVEIFNLGRIFTAFSALYMGFKYKHTGGAICGIIGTFGVILGNAAYAGLMAMIAFAALIAGVFSKLGRFSQTVTFVFVNGIGLLMIGITPTTVCILADVFIASVLYMLIPCSEREMFGDTDKGKRPSADLSGYVAAKLDFAGVTLENLCRTIDATAVTLEKAGKPDSSWVYNTACENTCRKCRFSMRCWGSDYDSMIDVMRKIVAKMQTGSLAREDDFPDYLRSRCSRQEQLISALNKNYGEYFSIQSTYKKLADMRWLLTEQLNCTESMLKEIAREVSLNREYNAPAAEKALTVFKSCGLVNPKVVAYINEDGRVNIEAYGEGDIVISSEELCERIISAVGRDFDIPEIVRGKNIVKVTLFERATYCIELHCSQINKGNNSVCGDYFDSFTDGNGHAYMILSDGMGSGSRARLDSSFACNMLIKLLRAGIEFKSAVKIINTSLLVKSADESFATLDIVRINLYNGYMQIIKAGACSTYIKHGKKVSKVTSNSLPVGIMKTVSLEIQEYKITANDVIIMTSDGAEFNSEWLERELKKSDSVTAKDLAEHLIACAKHSGGGRDDDISIIAVKLVK